MLQRYFELDFIPMEIEIIKEKSITKEELRSIAEKTFGSLIKVVVDVEQGIMAVGGELHADEEVFLMEKEGSQRENTWGINLYPDKQKEEWLELDSIINIKPSFGNRSRGIENQEVVDKIRDIVEKLVRD